MYSQRTAREKTFAVLCRYAAENSNCDTLNTEMNMLLAWLIGMFSLCLVAGDNHCR